MNTRRSVSSALRHVEEDQPSVADVVAMLEAEGVRSVEALVERMLHDLRREDLPPPSFVDPDEMMRPSTVEPRPHQVPRMPFILDDVHHEPEDIVRFNGQELHFVMARHRPGENLLLAYRDRMNPFATYLRLKTHLWAGALWESNTRDGGFPMPGTPGGTGEPQRPPGVGQGCGFMGAQPCQPGIPSPPHDEAQIQMFDERHYGGNWFWLDRRFSWTDLTMVRRAGMFGFSSNWNDEIDSLASVNASIRYFEHIHFRGSSLTLPPKTPIADLEDSGWNARISSVQNLG
jgi:hypothetical protein